jgi:hypothetical protein
MDRNEIKLGLAVMGVGALYFSIKGICMWLVDRTFDAVDNTNIVGKLSQEVEIYSYKDDPKKWSDLDKPEQCETFDLVPAYFCIKDQTDDRIVIEMPTKKMVCKFDPAVDLRLNTCTLLKCRPSTDQNYNGVLNHPTQLGIILNPGCSVVVYGFLDKHDIFHIQRLTNYDVNRYKDVLVSQKMWKVGYYLFGASVFGCLAILFQQYKE